MKHFCPNFRIQNRLKSLFLCCWKMINFSVLPSTFKGQKWLPWTELSVWQPWRLTKHFYAEMLIAFNFHMPSDIDLQFVPSNSVQIESPKHYVTPLTSERNLCDCCVIKILFRNVQPCALQIFLWSRVHFDDQIFCE